MATRIMTLRLDPSKATLADVREKYALHPDEADEHFGVVSVSPPDNLYSILVPEATAVRMEGADGVVGAFSNPMIAPFGPVQP